MSTMRTILATVVATIAATAVVGVLGVYSFVNSGRYDIWATTSDRSLVYWITHQTVEHSVALRRGDNVVPVGLQMQAKIAEGGQIFVANCAVCHGRPDLAPTAIAQALNPAPTDLYRATRAPDEQENYQFIAHGIKMTAITAFSPSQSEDQLWSLVAFLNVLPGITAHEFKSVILSPVTLPTAPTAN